MSQEMDPLAGGSGVRWVSWVTIPGQSPGPGNPLAPDGSTIKLQLTREVRLVDKYRDGERVPDGRGGWKQNISVVGRVLECSFRPEYVGEERQLVFPRVGERLDEHAAFARLAAAQKQLGRRAQAGDILTLTKQGQTEGGRPAPRFAPATFTPGQLPTQPGPDPLTAQAQPATPTAAPAPSAQVAAESAW